MKLTIGSLDQPTLDVEAHYNPKEIDLGKQTSWQDEGAINGRVRSGENDVIDLEYTGSPARSMSLELLFDGFETNKSVEPIIQRLQEMASPRDEQSTLPEWRRPHVCVVTWSKKDFPNFRCVIESIAVKYTMFSKEGRALRATCSVKLKEARLRKDLRGR
jgi:hypothetical protein